jgi:Terminase large subunit, T4likevirus-type, N-terminal
VSTASLAKEVRRLRERRISLRKVIPADRVEFARLVGYEPDSWQEQLLHSTAPRVLINASRQSGKSSMAAVIAMHQALAAPPSTVLILSPALRQSAELYRKCAEIYGALGRPVSADSETRLGLDLSNGSRVLSLPGRTGDTVRGYTADLLICDEASRIEDDLYASIRPMLATTGGRLLTLSTPAGRRGWWFEAWTSSGPSWQRYEVTVEHVPRISEEFIEEERHALPRRVFDQEYCCKFVEIEDAVFSLEDIENAIRTDVEPLFGAAS